MGKELLVVLETEKNLDEAREICKQFFLSQEYEIVGEASELVVFKGGDFLWTVLGTYRWHKIVKTITVSFQKIDEKLRIKLNYDVSRLATTFSLIRSAKHEIEGIRKKLDAKIIEMKEQRSFIK